MANIANTDGDTDVRVAAIARLRNIGTLIKLAKTEGETDVRVAAIARIGDEELLAKLAGKEHDIHVQAAARKQLGKVKLLQGTNTKEVVAGIERGDLDNKELAMIASDEGKDLAIRAAAIQHIQNEPALLRALRKSGCSEEIRLIVDAQLNELTRREREFKQELARPRPRSNGMLARPR